MNEQRQSVTVNSENIAVREVTLTAHCPRVQRRVLPYTLDRGAA
ncbi:MAG: hypothetical protein ACJAYU_002721 [Bradymonadia bacterium]|jgi:hypothetical protein